MNDKRRRHLGVATFRLNQAYRIIQDCQTEEQEAFENMPESLQDGERGTVLRDNADALLEVIEEIMALAKRIETMVEGV